MSDQSEARRVGETHHRVTSCRLVEWRHAWAPLGNLLAHTSVAFTHKKPEMNTECTVADGATTCAVPAQQHSPASIAKSTKGANLHSDASTNAFKVQSHRKSASLVNTLWVKQSMALVTNES
ncbi:Aste57867_8191 [Aphanomyces stellatus]|uniref:Aste57867_8191 protein n=1 Tax=Aphanomyces stellatus TaxID=120398 RepID=A0A485KJL0_9STRA|nr:hypothetical protein As57867_008160 [Aphanomyces stellatus]VFT85079.1 Aste57867_8191 [Aphanomyces stellatus]